MLKILWKRLSHYLMHSACIGYYKESTNMIDNSGGIDEYEKLQAYHE